MTLSTPAIWLLNVRAQLAQNSANCDVVGWIIVRCEITQTRTQFEKFQDRSDDLTYTLPRMRVLQPAQSNQDLLLLKILIWPVCYISE